LPKYPAGHEQVLPTNGLLHEHEKLEAESDVQTAPF